MAFGLRSLVAAVGLLAAMPLSLAASFQQVTNFGTNPTSATMYIYVPDTLPAKPAVIVGIHWCSGTASAFYSGTQYAAQAAALGYIVIYPNAGTSDGCWDVASDATLTHNGGSHSKAIKTMVDYVLKTYNADASRVYATGVSSGAMMTNVLLATYPDVFAAGSSFAGVPYHCFAGPTSWNSNCAQGLITKTAQEWGDLARAAYPGYTGKRPKMQLFHGDKDEVLSFVNHGEAIKQWTNVLGISSTPTKSETNVPQTGWKRDIYGNGLVEAVVEIGLAHNLVVLTNEALRFFGLTGTTTTPTPSVPTTTPTATPTGGLVAKWGQCGGIDYTGSTSCVSGTTCTVVNPYYSQCL